MLRCKDVVVVKDQSGKVVATVPYERTYYSYGAGDQIETVEVTANGEVVGTKERPIGKSRWDSQTLFSEMIQDLQHENPGTDPLVTVLSEVEYSKDLATRNKKRAQTLAAQESPEKAISSMVKMLCRKIPGLSESAARAIIEQARSNA